jgi:hypothetical protein
LLLLIRRQLFFRCSPFSLSPCRVSPFRLSQHCLSQFRLSPLPLRLLSSPPLPPRLILSLSLRLHLLIGLPLGGGSLRSALELVMPQPLGRIRLGLGCSILLPLKLYGPLVCNDLVGEQTSA